MPLPLGLAEVWPLISGFPVQRLFKGVTYKHSHQTQMTTTPAKRTEFTDDMFDRLKEYYACDPDFCLEAAERYINQSEEADLIEFYNEVFED